jgi:hypothetical protein
MLPEWYLSSGNLQLYDFGGSGLQPSGSIGSEVLDDHDVMGSFYAPEGRFKAASCLVMSCAVQWLPILRRKN